MKRLILFLLAILWNQLLCGQVQVAGMDAIHYSVQNNSDHIDYLKVGGDTTTAKPTLLFLQGSLPVPLVIDFEKFMHVNLPFNCKAFTDQFHVVVISMPHTPVVVPHYQLNDQYSFVTDTADPQSFSEDFLRDNVLSSYVERATVVIEDLLEKSWTTDAVHVVGHSQGAKVACVVAAQDNRMSTVSLLGFNAYGRYDELLRRQRKALQSGKISGEAYLQKTDKLYADWQEIVTDSTDFKRGHNAWISFSIDYRPYLLKIDQPLFVGFGTEDVSAENCDLLPLDFIRAGKQNLTLQPYVGYDHNFFDTEKPGTGPYWDEVMTDVVDWIVEVEVRNR